MSVGVGKDDRGGTAVSPSTGARDPIPERAVATAADAEVPGIVASGDYAGGRRVADIRIDEVGEWAQRPDHVVWIGLYQPSMELLVEVQARFGLHRLAIKDAMHAHQRPKVERYGDCLSRSAVYSSTS